MTFAAFQSNAFQSNAFQIAESGDTPSPVDTHDGGYHVVPNGKKRTVGNLILLYEKVIESAPKTETEEILSIIEPFIEPESPIQPAPLPAEFIDFSSLFENQAALSALSVELLKLQLLIEERKKEQADLEDFMLLTLIACS